MGAWFKSIFKIQDFKKEKRDPWQEKKINLENPLRCKELSEKGDRKIFRGFKTIEWQWGIRLKNRQLALFISVIQSSLPIPQLTSIILLEHKVYLDPSRTKA